MKPQVFGFAILVLAGAVTLSAVEPAQDPLLRMPGTQPADGVTLEAPNRCFNCHGDYNSSVEPGFNWQGSMMAQAARDFLFWACLTVAGQDSQWAIGSPNAVDLCERCHFPSGWLAGRSNPPNASAMTGADFDGVHCDVCHSMYDPFFESTYSGAREGSDWVGYWDETGDSSTPSGPAAAETYSEDASLAQTVDLFSGESFFINNLPFSADYTENGSGQYFVSPGGEKRASFADAAARHKMLYSRYHKSKYFCGSCHDVSNPVLANLGADPSLPLPSERNPAFSYFHVERTFSEFMLSDYGQQGGAAGIGPFAPTQFETSLSNNYVSKCQDCHMRDDVGLACNKNGVPIRPYESVEHPNSGLPLHDLTGGNAWVLYVLASAIPGSTNYDATNDGLLNQGPAALTLDLTQGMGVDPAALLAGADRAKQQLQLAASIENLIYDSSSGALSFRIQNQTGHKLISGFPEGRRMFVNIEIYSGDNEIYEVNPYDETAGTLKGLPSSYSPNSPPLGPYEAYVDELVYELHPSSSLTGESQTFHFVLADGRHKDNRIPPKGFRVAQAGARASVPVWHGVEDANYFTAAEYAGGYDDVSLTVPSGGTAVEVNLYYQTTSREYIEFLRDEINGQNPTLPDLSAYIIQTDPFYAGLKAWGDTIWQLWTHNKDVDGAKPFLMASAFLGDVGGCPAEIPSLLQAVPGHQQVTLTWSDEHSSDAEVVGYGVYYDQSGKAQLITNVGLTTTYTDTGLTNGQEYCYRVTSRYTGCESAFSNVLCAIPNNQGQADIGVSNLESGRYETPVKGKNASVVFVARGTLNVGDNVVFRASVADGSTGLPVANATVEIAISGPEAVSLTTGPSDSDGWAFADWQTHAKTDKKGNEATSTGLYTATVTNVSAAGYTWDGVGTSTQFTLE